MLAVLLLGRTRRQAGDYEGALRTFEEQLRLAEPAGDMQQVGDTHRELGTVQLMRGQAPEALRHFRESHAIYKSLGGQQGAVANSLVKQADALWRLGRGDEARAALVEADAIAAATGSAGKETLAYLNNVWAHLALSEQRFAEAAAKASAALAAGTQSKDTSAEAKRAACAAALRTGARARGRALCEEAARHAEEAGDRLLFVSLARLTLAEALFETGDSAGALNAALSANEFFARVGAADAEWRASAVAARAAQRAGDGEAARQHVARAEEALSRLKQSWGEEASAGFLARPDVKELYRWLGGLPNAAAP
jgi:tetratricopeptide (TPR) repeat protein